MKLRNLVIGLLATCSVVQSVAAQTAPPRAPSLVSSAVTGVTQSTDASAQTTLTFNILLTFKNNSPADGDFQLTKTTYNPLPFGGFIGTAVFETIPGSSDPTVTINLSFSRQATSGAYVSYEVRARNGAGFSSAARATIKPPGGAVPYQPYTSLAALSDTPGAITLAIADAWPDEGSIEVFVLNGSGQVLQQLLRSRDEVRLHVEGLDPGSYTVYARPQKPGIAVAYAATTVTVTEAASPPPTIAPPASPSPQPTAQPTQGTPFLVQKPGIYKVKRSITLSCRTSQPDATVSAILVDTKAPGKEKRIRAKKTKATSNQAGGRSFGATFKGLKPGSYKAMCEVTATVTVRGPGVSVKIK